MAGYKMISMVLLVVLVALAVGSPVFAQRIAITLTPASACPGTRVMVTLPPDDIVGGGISIAAVSPLSYITPVLSSDPVGLMAYPECSVGKPMCTFVVSESATCGGHYTVIVTFPLAGTTYSVDDSALSVSAPFDVAGPCCAVGGCVQPANTFALLSPWMAVIGLIGCIGTVVVVAKKRHP